MTFNDIVGNSEVKQALAGMVDSCRVPHAILFHEENGGGAFRMAIAFLDYLYGGNPRVSKLIHPDVHFIFPTASKNLSEQYLDSFRKLASENPDFTEEQLNDALGIEGKSIMIAVSEATHLLETLSLSALEGGYRSVVIYLPEKMNQEAANRLLKMIEEPPEKTQFLLITHAPEKVLVTIASRCQRIRISPSETSRAPEFADAVLMDDLMSALIEKNLLKALEAGDAIAALQGRENIKAFCKFAAARMRQVFLIQQGLASLSDNSDNVALWASKFRRTFPRLALEAISRAQQLIDRNVNSKIVFTDLVNRLYMGI